ncbi:MAG TPA: RidA family protein [Acidimicrobiia bacterium]
MTRSKVASNRIWSEVGYSRAVRVGPLIEVAGTGAATPDGEILFPGDLYRQTQEVLKTIVEAIEQLGGTTADVTRTRVFVTDIDRWKEAGRAHGEVFGDVQPASAFMEVQRLLHPDMLVEIEATAYVE